MFDGSPIEDTDPFQLLKPHENVWIQNVDCFCSSFPEGSDEFNPR